MWHFWNLIQPKLCIYVQYNFVTIVTVVFVTFDCCCSARFVKFVCCCSYAKRSIVMCWKPELYWSELVNKTELDVLTFNYFSLVKGFRVNSEFGERNSKLRHWICSFYTSSNFRFVFFLRLALNLPGLITSIPLWWGRNFYDIEFPDDGTNIFMSISLLILLILFSFCTVFIEILRNSEKRFILRLAGFPALEPKSRLK